MSLMQFTSSMSCTNLEIRSQTSKSAVSESWTNADQTTLKPYTKLKKNKEERNRLCFELTGKSKKIKKLTVKASMEDTTKAAMGSSIGYPRFAPKTPKSATKEASASLRWCQALAINTYHIDIGHSKT